MRRTLVAALTCALAGVGAALAEDAGQEKEIRSHADAFVAAWNKHDAKAMAALFAPDGDLINPFGRSAKGRDEVEKLFADEHSTFMKDTTFVMKSLKVRFVSPTVAFADTEDEITGMHNPDGSAMPPSKGHGNTLLVKKGGHWWVVASRPVAYMTAPAPAAK